MPPGLPTCPGNPGAVLAAPSKPPNPAPPKPDLSSPTCPRLLPARHLAAWPLLPCQSPAGGILARTPNTLPWQDVATKRAGAACGLHRARGSASARGRT